MRIQRPSVLQGHRDPFGKEDAPRSIYQSKRAREAQEKKRPKRTGGDRDAPSRLTTKEARLKHPQLTRTINWDPGCH